MRVHKNDSTVQRMRSDENVDREEADFEIIYENVKNYLVFKISITTKIKERMIYMDILNYMERIQLEAQKNKGR